ncbi:hypothetical protein [Flammeovirga pacifica]|uniref:Uncharacterized protein n=1 Tax=Flammeovirga pacifica TaxID=915059 RepID=A0A1S1YWP8_FLAPC|nr:hypothetical protein [Flammeovirga pacifica]OHX65255.1 hypothetical protein NH26_02250 [Flammeovirga pacifica]
MKHLLSIILFTLFSQLAIGQNNILLTSSVFQTNGKVENFVSKSLKSKIKNLFNQENQTVEASTYSENQLFDLMLEATQSLNLKSTDTFKKIKFVEVVNQNQQSINLNTKDADRLEMGDIFNVLKQKIYDMSN